MASAKNRNERDNWPAQNGEAADISAADHTFAQITRGVYIGTAGDLVVVTAGGSTLTFVGLAAGVIHPIACATIVDSSTAANIVGVW